MYLKEIALTLIENIKLTLTWVVSWTMVVIESNQGVKEGIYRNLTAPDPETMLLLDFTIKILTIISLIVAITFTIKKGVAKK